MVTSAHEGREVTVAVDHKSKTAPNLHMPRIAANSRELRQAHRFAEEENRRVSVTRLRVFEQPGYAGEVCDDAEVERARGEVVGYV